MVRDALTMGPREHEDDVTPHTRPPADEDADHLLVRTVRCLEGTVEVELICEPAFDYGRIPAQWVLTDGGRNIATATGGERPVRLQTDLDLGIEGDRVRGRHVLNAGDELYCALSWADELVPVTNVADATRRLEATTRYWRNWLGGARLPDHRWRDPIQRSALTIKGLTYMPTGATVAALTTSLPETPGGERNWDYRYTWIRDTTFTLQALHYLNLDWEADEFMQFIARPGAQSGRRPADHVWHRRPARPRRVHPRGTVRLRRGASGPDRQRSLRPAAERRLRCGARLDPAHSRRSQRLPRRLWGLVESQARCAEAIWREPDQGIWEARGKPQQYVSSKLMCWVALNRAAVLAEIRADDSLVDGWRATAEEIKQDILAHGLTADGVLRQHYETDSLDASTLLAAMFGFLPPDDERLHASVLAIADHLTEDGFVLRYRTDETDDGLSGKEGSFLICSFWLVSALSIVGEQQRARDLMERLLRVASPLGLYAEEFDVATGRHLGNFPQAFSHLALIEAAGRIILSERLAEI